MLVPITRRQIEWVCSYIDLVPALDTYSSKAATKVFVERLKKQLEGKQIKEGSQYLELLLTYVTKRHNIARIPDYTFGGLQAEEAISREIAQISQDAFKVVVKTAVISNMVDSLQAITDTVKDRRDPICTVHFDKSYSKFHNYTRREVVAMRSVFVMTTIKDLFMDPPVVGVLEKFDNDNVPESLRELREVCLERYSAKSLKPEMWNKITAARDNPFSKSVLVMRFTFDPATIYARNLTMMDVVSTMRRALSSVSDYEVGISASSIKHATVDVCVWTPGAHKDKYSTMYEAELLVLDSEVRVMASSATTGGIKGIQAMSVNSVSLATLMKTSKPSEYHMVDQGRRRWIRDYGLEEVPNLDDCVAIMESKSLEDGHAILYEDGTNSYVYYPDSDYPDYEVTRPAEEDLDYAYANYLCKGADDVWVIELGAIAMKAVGITYEQEILPLLEYCGLDVIYVGYHELMDLPYYVYVSCPMDPSKVIALHTGMPLNAYDILSDPAKESVAESFVAEKSKGGTTQGTTQKNVVAFFEANKKEMLTYDALSDAVKARVADLFAAERSEGGTKEKSVAAFFESNKKEISERVVMYTYNNISAAAKESVMELFVEEESKGNPTANNVAAFFEANRKEISERVGTYVYASMHLSRKGAGKVEQYYYNFNTVPYLLHVTPHAYQSILTVPFVDANRSYSNDWHTNTYTLGVDCARNIYAGEFYSLMPKPSTTDPRHIELFADIVFSSGHASGAGQNSGDDHGRGTMSQLNSDKQKRQLSKAFNKDPESIRSVDVATFYGAPPVPDMSKNVFVEASTKRQRREMEIAGIRTGKGLPMATSFVVSEPALEASARARLIDNDPFSVVDDISAPRVFPNLPDMSVSMVNMLLDDLIYVNDDLIDVNSNVLERVNSKLKKWEDDLARRRSYTRIVRPIMLPDTARVVDLNALLAFLGTYPFV